MAYLLDANVFIQAKNTYYGFGFCPAFWDWIQRANGQGKVFSIDRVRFELEGGVDELAEWASKQTNNFFLPTDSGVLAELPKVNGWVSAKKYDARAIHDFQSKADAFLVAAALSKKFSVVTLEKPSDGAKVKIPNVCAGVGVPFLATWEMLKVEKARFVLG